jgi:hypothetical protein
VVSVCDGRGCGAFAYRELLGNRSVGWVEPVDAFDEYVLEVVIVVAGVGPVVGSMRAPSQLRHCG